MKQIHKTVQALESDIGFWRPSLILLKKLKNTKKITGQIPQGQQIFKNYSEQGCIAILSNFDHSQNKQN